MSNPADASNVQVQGGEGAGGGGAEVAAAVDADIKPKLGLTISLDARKRSPSTTPPLTPVEDRPMSSKAAVKDSNNPTSSSSAAPADTAVKDETHKDQVHEKRHSNEGDATKTATGEGGESGEGSMSGAEGAGSVSRGGGGAGVGGSISVAAFEYQKQASRAFSIIPDKAPMTQHGYASIGPRTEADQRIDKHSLGIVINALIVIILAFPIIELEWNSTAEAFDQNNKVSFGLRMVSSVLCVSAVTQHYFLYSAMLDCKYPGITLQWWRPFANYKIWIDIIVHLLHLPPIPNVGGNIIYELLVFFRMYALARVLRFHESAVKIRKGVLKSGLAPNQRSSFAIKNVLGSDPWMGIIVSLVVSVPIGGYCLNTITREGVDLTDRSWSDSTWFLFNVMMIQNMSRDPNRGSRPLLILAAVLGVLIVSFIVTTLSKALQLDGAQTANIKETIKKDLEQQLKRLAAKYIHSVYRWSKNKKSKDLKRDIALAKAAFGKVFRELETAKRESRQDLDLSQMVVQMSFSMVGLEERLLSAKEDLFAKLMEVKAEVAANTALLRMITEEKYGMMDDKQTSLGQHLKSLAKFAQHKAKTHVQRFNKIHEQIAELEALVGTGSTALRTNHANLTQQVKTYEEFRSNDVKQTEQEQSQLQSNLKQQSEWARTNQSTLEKQQKDISTELGKLDEYQKQEFETREVKMINLEKQGQSLDKRVGEQIWNIEQENKATGLNAQQMSRARAAELAEIRAGMAELKRQGKERQAVLESVSSSLHALAKLVNVVQSEAASKVATQEQAQGATADAIKLLAQQLAQMQETLARAGNQNLPPVTV